MSLKTDWLVYVEMTRVGSTAYVRGVTMVSPVAVAHTSREGEGGGGNLYAEESSDSEVDDNTNTTVIVDTWIPILTRQEVATQVIQLR